KGQDALARGHKKDVSAAQKTELWATAAQHLKEAIDRAGNEADPKLKELREKATALHAEAKRGVQERQRFIRFGELHEEAFLLVGRAAGGDPGVNQDQTRRAALEALDVLGVKLDGSGGPTLDTRFFDAEEVQRAITDCYEMLVILARVVAFPPGRKP